MDNNILDIYRSHPMDDGDVVVLIDSQMATEIEGLADEWDDVLCRNVAVVLRGVTVREVRVGVARPHAALHERDHRLLSDLRNELAEAGITVHGPIPLPAAPSSTAA